MSCSAIIESNKQEKKKQIQIPEFETEIDKLVQTWSKTYLNMTWAYKDQLAGHHGLTMKDWFHLALSYRPCIRASKLVNDKL